MEDNMTTFFITVLVIWGAWAMLKFTLKNFFAVVWTTILVSAGFIYWLSLTPSA